MILNPLGQTLSPLPVAAESDSVAATICDRTIKYEVPQSLPRGRLSSDRKLGPLRAAMFL